MAKSSPPAVAHAGVVERYVVIFDQKPNNRNFNDKLREFLDRTAGWCRWWEADVYLIDYAGTASELFQALDATNLFKRLLVLELLDAASHSGFLRPEAWNWLRKPPGACGGSERSATDDLKLRVKEYGDG